MNLWMRQSGVLILGLLCAVALSLLPTPASAESVFVRDNYEGEAENTFSVDTARFTVGDRRATVVAKHGRLMPKKGPIYLYIDFLVPYIEGRQDEYLRVQYVRGTPGADFKLFSRVTGETVHCNWQRTVNRKKKTVRVSLAAGCFGARSDYRSLRMAYGSYGKNLSGPDEVYPDREVRRG